MGRFCGSFSCFLFCFPAAVPIILFAKGRDILLTIVFFALWLIFNGRFTVELALFGLAISLALTAFVRRFMLKDWSFRKEVSILRKTPAFLRYCWLLVKEITLANEQVLHLILSNRREVQPKLATFKTKLVSPVSRVILADCITLTPGTITVSLEDDTYVVHCLDESFEEGLVDSSFEKRLSVLEKIGAGKEDAHA